MRHSCSHSATGIRRGGQKGDGLLFFLLLGLGKQLSPHVSCQMLTGGGPECYLGTTPKHSSSRAGPTDDGHIHCYIKNNTKKKSGRWVLEFVWLELEGRNKKYRRAEQRPEPARSEQVCRDGWLQGTTRRRELGAMRVAIQYLKYRCTVCTAVQCSQHCMRRDARPAFRAASPLARWR